MSDLAVRIVRLPPMRVACVRVISAIPERDAWEKLQAWAKPKGLLANLEQHPVFGFNNPNPTPQSRQYGYEFWIAVGPEIGPEGEIEVTGFAGGLYAVTTCRLKGDPQGTVQEIWMKLWSWVQASKYRWRRTHELEKPHDPSAAEQDLVLELYLPIEE
jgi:DNA gyrase inhibitor GyrI